MSWGFIKIMLIHVSGIAGLCGGWYALSVGQLYLGYALLAVGAIPLLFCLSAYCLLRNFKM